MQYLPDKLRLMIERMRLVGSDLQQCEVKEAVVKLPENLLETISAFSNANGGTIILGLSERNGFAPADGFDANRIHQSVLQISSQLVPPCRPEVEIYPFEGSSIVVVTIAPVAYDQKPCYILKRGAYEGSYVRTGDGDRRLTRYEVDRLQEFRRQTTYDLEIIEDATIDDLDPDLIKAIVKRNREITPRILGRLPDMDILSKLGCVRPYGGSWKPTLGGLMAAGLYPQQFFPRLNITFTVYPGTSKAQKDGTLIRYLDSASINGSIPEMLQSATEFLKKNMRTGALIDETFRQEISDYPVRAFREALINALQHRDYSPEARGSQVQVNLFADRLEILNPGGLYGCATLDSSGPGMSATRNTFLSKILETTPYTDENGIPGFVIENKGTGLIEIRQSLADALMPPPIFKDYISAFDTVFTKRRLSEAETKHKRWNNFEEGLSKALTKKTTLSIADIVDMSGISRNSVYSYVNRLLKKGVIERTEPAHSPKQRYRLKI